MKNLLLILLVLTLPAAVFGTTHTITSLPYTFETADMTGGGETDTLVLSGTLHSDGDGITLYGSFLNNVVLDLGGDTVYFGEDGGVGHRGLEINGPTSTRPYNITVINGGFIHNPPSQTGVYNCLGLYLQGHDVTIEDVYFEAKNGNGTTIDETTRCAESGGSNTYGNVFRNCQFKNSSTGHYRRDYYTGATFHIDNCRGFYEVPPVGYLGDPEDFYHFTFDSCTFEGIHAQLVVYGRSGDAGGARLIFTNNTTIPDARNDTYSYPSGNILYGDANAYGLVTTYLSGGSIINDNDFLAGTSYGGGRGLYIGTMQWDDSTYSEQPVQIYRNYINIHQGPGDYYRPMPAHGIRVRQNNIRWLDFQHDTVIVHADDDVGTTHTDEEAYALRWSPYQGESEFCSFEGCLFVCSTTVNNNSTAAICWDAAIIGSPNLVFTGNKALSQGTIIRYAVQSSADSLAMGPNDTLGFIEPTVNPYTFELCTDGYSIDAVGNTITDPVFIDGAGPEDFRFANVGSKDVTISRTLSIYVQGAVNSQPRSGATVTVLNNLDDTVMTGTTSSGGLVTGTVTMVHAGNSSVDTSLADVNPFRLYASYGGANSSNIAFYAGFNSADSANDTLSLTGISGDGTWNNSSPAISGIYPSGITSYAFGDTILPRFSVTDDNGLQYAFLFLIKPTGDSVLVAGTYFSTTTPLSYADTGQYVLNQFSGTFYLRAHALDTAGDLTSQSSVANYVAPASTNAAPTFTSITPSNDLTMLALTARAYSYSVSDDFGLDSVLGYVIRAGTIIDTLFDQAVSGATATINGMWTPGATDTGYVWFVGRVVDDSAAVTIDSCLLVNYVNQANPSAITVRGAVTMRERAILRSDNDLTEVPDPSE